MIIRVQGSHSDQGGVGRGIEMRERRRRGGFGLVVVHINEPPPSLITLSPTFLLLTPLDIILLPTTSQASYTSWKKWTGSRNWRKP